MFWPYEVRYLSFPMSLTSSGWSPWRPRSNRACSPARRLERPDGAPLPPDDPPLHLLRGEGNRRDDALGDVIGRVPLDGERNHLLGLLPRLLLDLFLDRADLLRCVQPGLVRDHLHEFGLRLVGRHLRDPLEVFLRTAGQVLEFLVPPCKPVLRLGPLLFLLCKFLRPALEGLGLPVERVFLLEKSLLELADLVLSLAGLPLEIEFHLELIILGLEHRLLQVVLGLLPCIVENLLRLGRRFLGPILRKFLLRHQRENDEREARHEHRKRRDDDHIRIQRIPPSYPIYFMSRSTTPVSATTASTRSSHASTGTSGTSC